MSASIMSDGRKSSPSLHKATTTLPSESDAEVGDRKQKCCLTLVNLSAGGTRCSKSCSHDLCVELKLLSQTTIRSSLTTNSENTLIQTPTGWRLFPVRRGQSAPLKEINQAHFGTGNKFVAYTVYGNLICVLPCFHGKVIPFSSFQRP